MVNSTLCVSIQTPFRSVTGGQPRGAADGQPLLSEARAGLSHLPRGSSGWTWGPSRAPRGPAATPGPSPALSGPAPRAPAPVRAGRPGRGPGSSNSCFVWCLSVISLDSVQQSSGRVTHEASGSRHSQAPLLLQSKGDSRGQRQWQGDTSSILMSGLCSGSLAAAQGLSWARRTLTPAGWAQSSHPALHHQKLRLRGRWPRRRWGQRAAHTRGAWSAEHWAKLTATLARPRLGSWGMWTRTIAEEAQVPQTHLVLLHRHPVRTRTEDSEDGRLPEHRHSLPPHTPGRRVKAGSGEETDTYWTLTGICDPLSLCDNLSLCDTIPTYALCPWAPLQSWDFPPLPHPIPYH